MPASTTAVEGHGGDLRLVAHRGDRAVLLAMDLPADKVERLAGFALFRKVPGGKPWPLYNRLDFTTPITSATAPEQRDWHRSDLAPFQKFRWVDIPPDVRAGDYEYTATAMYFDANDKLRAGDSATVSLDIAVKPAERLTVGFTRGYMSSQAYATKFHNEPFHPEPQTIDFDTGPYRKKDAWLGFHARELIAGFLEDCVSDAAITVDAFAYDLNDPDIIGALQALGPRLRLLLDNATLHRDTHPAPPAKPTHVLETDAAAAIAASGAAVRRGRFKRFAHSKVFIARRNGAAVRVLTGSTNFSLRGLYVQANNVLVFDSPAVAHWFEDAFVQSWTTKGMREFAASPIASGWFELPADGLPPGAIAFSPHTSGDVSLKRVSDAIRGASTSLLFSVMGLDGGGDVLKQLRGGMAKPGLFSYGVTQAGDAFMQLYKPGSTRAVRVTFAYLHGQVPAPFHAEIAGGAGQVIHDKFVVVDFGGTDPRVYTGSSNLASGGEEENGDNLIELRGPDVASLYAVEAVRQIDHFHFRAAMKDATTADPLVLKGPDRWHEWVDPYYDPGDLKSLDRQLFARVPAG
jgi:phosphatidylserine/phosphatidylglycerophosphate/cardiolipin synthase-like enzyme